ncbi:MerR family transcriptional regulator [Kribbella sandramycini]|uniref:MerR family gold-responsive transcriptional activator of gol and ges genes n=1 Tax=Kribbella sandramycini TaxID=60450 RepID=A0A7Y4KZC3_9ACTN|nr:MerR family transcriptional regulator [Kribbella sandramycini]MBB6565183.1 MerR family gold-responsive transcriptional activator of gol and ges genes [Kribbella sandramycini]NOL41453.1 MerR family transcriptional regulator [Kribbella sandramycini]
MRIGEVANRLGVATHVLRHWDDAGVVVPERTATGHREYTEDHLYRLRVLQACQAVGMSLPEIRQVLNRREPHRTGVIERRLQWIRAQREQLANAERFLVHVIGCEHDLLTRCANCSEYAGVSRDRSGC